jgi:hypothetical protein
MYGKDPVAHAPTPAESRIRVRYTEVRADAKIRFQQDSSQTEEKYYLEAMGTGVAWIDDDQDGLPDLFLVPSAATDVCQPVHPLRSALYPNNADGTFADGSEKAGLADENGWSSSAGWFDDDRDLAQRTSQSPEERADRPDHYGQRRPGCRGPSFSQDQDSTVIE